MRSLRAALGLLLAATAVDAIVHRDQVDDIDFHHKLVGLPQRDTTFFQRPRPDDKASLLYTLSDAAVLGAINPSTGAIVWRQLLETDDQPASQPRESPRHVEAVAGEGWIVAGAASSVQAWDAVSGRNVWWQDFAGVVADVAVIAPPTTPKTPKIIVPVSRSDVLAVAYDAAAAQLVLRRLAGNDGRVLWEYRESAAASPAVLHVTSAADGKAHVVFTSAAAGLKVLTVDSLTGHRVDEHVLASDVHAAKDVLVVGSGIVAWTDTGLAKLKVAVLGAKHKSEFALPEGTTQVLVHALPAASASAPLHFLVHTRTADAHRASVFHVTDAKKGTVQKAYDLPQAAGAGAFAVTVGDAANILFTRVTDDEMVLVDSASHDILGRWPVADKTPLHALGVATAEIVAKDTAGDYAVRVAVLTADEDWVLLRNNGQRAWTRHEGLTGAVTAVLVDRPESEQLVRALEEEEAKSPLEAYIHRVQRHFDDLEQLPVYLQSVPARLIASILGGDAATAGTAGAPDAFGFHQIAILATRRGRLYAIDASSPGTVLWTVQAVELAHGQRWAVKTIHVDEAAGVAIVVGATASQSVTVKYQTGETVADAAALALANVSGPVASAVLVSSAAGPWLLAVSADGQVPTDVPADKCPKEVLTVFPASSSSIHGVQYVLAGGRCTPETTWTFSPPPQFRIVHVATRPAHDPVASIGRVLGDRRVLYKYLNPNLAVVAALNDDTGALLTLLLDTVSGQVLSTSAYSGVDGTKPVECLLFENTFACTFFADYATDEQPAQGIKGYHLTVSDIYESLAPNSRGLAGDSAASVSAYAPVRAVLGDDSADALLPAVVSHTFVLGSRLSALAVSQTRQGVTVRQVLAYVPRVHGIIGIPRVGGVLDARRPVGRDATPAEMEEGLSRYMPAIEIDPRWVVSHERQVLGIERIVTAATHVESTSLVLAFGAVDVFGTRVAPSLAFDLLDKGFGKLQMLGTVAALAVGVFVLRPMVTKKQINLRWKAPM